MVGSFSTLEITGCLAVLRMFHGEISGSSAWSPPARAQTSLGGVPFWPGKTWHGDTGTVPVENKLRKGFHNDGQLFIFMVKNEQELISISMIVNGCEWNDIGLIH